MLALYYAPGACSLASHAALEEAGLPFEPRRLDFMAGDQRKPEFLAVNPHGKVPALVTPEGLITESPAVLAYIADAAPQARLLPEGGYARAQALSHLAYFASTVHGYGFAANFRPNRFTEDESAQASVKAKGRADVEQVYLPELNALAAGRDWVFDHFTVVDLYLAVFRRWGSRLGVDMSRYPDLLAHADRVAARPGFAAALAREGVRLDG